MKRLAIAAAAAVLALSACGGTITVEDPTVEINGNTYTLDQYNCIDAASEDNNIGFDEAEALFAEECS